MQYTCNPVIPIYDLIINFQCPVRSKYSLYHGLSRNNVLEKFFQWKTQRKEFEVKINKKSELGRVRYVGAFVVGVLGCRKWIEVFQEVVKN